jgi:AraC family transcriptional regulator
MTAAFETYLKRLQRVLDHIDRHLDDDLDLETISRIAAFSKFHFHRQFAAVFGMSLHRYVQLVRLKRASSRLMCRAGESVTGIAMDAGYDAPDAFARAFRQRVGQSPSEFRKAPDWASWLTAFGPVDTARSKLMQIIFDANDVTVVEVPSVPVAVIEHRGNRAAFAETRQRFIDSRNAAGVSPATSQTFMIFRSEREPENPADYSVDLCFATDGPVKDDGHVKPGVIPGGRCAVLRYPGNTTNLEPAAHFLYRDWLPASGEEVRDFPVYSRRRLVAIPDVPAHEVVLELFLPLK